MTSSSTLYHLALEDDWKVGRARGEYRVSTLGATLDEVGFIHCSFEHQVVAVANAYFASRRDVLVLTIDAARLASEVRVETAGEDAFPHLYGPLDIDAVVAVEPLRLGQDEVQFRWAPGEPQSPELPTEG